MFTKSFRFASWGATLLFSASVALAQRSPYENLVLADCGIGLGANGGSTSREMIYYPGDVWTGNGLDTYRPTMMVNVPWSGSYPWGQAGGVSATMPNGDVFTVHIDRSIKDPNPAGDAWHKYELEKPFKCYSYHWDKVYQLVDGKWCSSAYVCNHRGRPYVNPGSGGGNNNDKDDTTITGSTNSDWVELYEQTAENIVATVRRMFNDKSTDCDTTAISIGSGCTIEWSCHANEGHSELHSLQRLSTAFANLGKTKEYSSKRETKTRICRTPDTRPGREGQCLQWVDKVDHYVKVPRKIKMTMDNIPPKGSGRNPSEHGNMEYEIKCSKSSLECALCNIIGTGLTVPSAGVGASVLIGCISSPLCR
ncbi:hypothetical protein K4K51_002384 [Colletotrichum sp. SAR 10_75]|nr:hypothetical protein K4K51_002384 [Colletotrichum sp. SAR 10_75]